MPATESEQELAFPSYWDARCQDYDGDEPSHEWYESFEGLKQVFRKYVLTPKSPDTNPRMIHLGSGDSTIPAHLNALGYEDQIYIDFSSVVVQKMSQRHANRPGIKWIVGDVRDMKEIGDVTVDVAFDKGTLDTMISGNPWDPPDTVKENTKLYIDEVLRILKPNGVFLYIIYRQPHFMKRYLLRDGS